MEPHKTQNSNSNSKQATPTTHTFINQHIGLTIYVYITVHTRKPQQECQKKRHYATLEFLQKFAMMRNAVVT